MHKAAHELTVQLGERSYPIFIRDGALGQQDLGEYCAGDRVLIVSNETVAPLYMEQAKGSFPGKQIDTVVLPDGERFKNWEVLNRIFDTLLDRQHSRRTTLVALGGGVIGDMTGFAAAAYQRGVAFIQIPTSLLAQVDSSVGGKTGINHPLGKNMIGAFHQPQAVLIDPASLATLPPHQFSAGMAEVIKYGLIRDEPFLAWLEEHVDELMALQPQVLAEAIRRSCECKAQVVAEDEHESGIRATLNLGHTFGHAIETHTGYSDWLHGEAVAVGMLMAADLSERLGWLNYNDSVRIRQLLLRVRLPVNPPEGMTPVHFKALMAVDKKNVTGQLRLVLLRSVGEAVVTEAFDPGLLDATLDHFCHPLD